MPANTPLSLWVSIPAELKARLILLSEQNDRSLSAEVRQALREYSSRHYDEVDAELVEQMVASIEG